MGCMMVFSTGALSDGEGAEPTPNGMVAEGDPDGSLSKKMGAIGDIRGINLATAARRMYPTMGPHSAIVTREDWGCEEGILRIPYYDIKKGILRGHLNGYDSVLIQHQYFCANLITVKLVAA